MTSLVTPPATTDLVEVLGVAARAAYAIEQLDSWMAEDERAADPAFYGTARAGIRYQPKGVVGNIVPWNFPFDLSAGPLVEMLAAGNRVIIKPSDDGIERFREFSNPRGVVVRGTGDLADAFLSPSGPVVQVIVDSVFGDAGGA